MTTISFQHFPKAEQEHVVSACTKAGMAIEEFEFFIDETFERDDGGHLRRVINIARKKPKVFRTYDASITKNWPFVFETALLSGDFK